ncbi:ATP-binding cassette domain-containing protein|uniref:Iron complex transport system ATP-binding protein n=1 Tax=Dendrosporobacter quercicolus TaxID=146817 RepID=A0A1G9YDM4_9FIRM|nr:ATP-binding cassette domain-containing protein [Dendrosporobacter quercicolus]NSL47603.1 ATP-binding cassette domain-containing protein [Dendrosporobacter quercicolus DSM 1736]SDN06571.1 iron complex transport system ATP-binding protein [Dendrosporobacter quercicolus]
MIEIKNAFKKYGGKTVVDRVSVTLEEGKLTAFIGSNGAGKSTLISMASRLLKMNGGEIYIDGTELQRWNHEQLARKISILRQANHTNLRLTIRELVSFGRYPYSRGKLTAEDLAQIDQAIDYMGIAAIQDSFLDELSGGQRQMAYIAMVIAQDTKYIFLDEPLNNLDMKHSVQIMKILRNLVDEKGKTILIVIHDINFVSCYADHIVALKAGRLLKSGPTAEIIKPEVLAEIYDMHIDICQIRGNNICVYYT